MPEIDPYAALGVPRTATRDEIARAYRRLAKLHHPDAGGPASPAMARINEAWSVLGSPGRRARWDRDHAVTQTPHWAATPASRQPMRPPPPVGAGPVSVRDTAWFAIAVTAAAALLLGLAMVGIALTGGSDPAAARIELDGVSLEVPDGWTAHAGDGTDSASHRVLAHLLTFSAAPTELCTSFDDRCPLSPGTVPAGEASVVITAWAEGSPPVPDPIIARPFGRDAERIIGGQPAAFELRRLGDGAIAWWQISPPGFPHRWIEITAYLGGAGRFEQDRNVRDIDAMLLTLHFTDP